MAYNPYTEMLMNQGDFNSAWNAEEARINRDWSEYMSSTSHQRETQDLLAAGLNPVLSTNQGAQWTAVGNPGSDAAIAQTYLNNKAALRMSEISADATRAAAGATAAATMAAAATSARATQYAADQNYNTQKYVADKSAEVGLTKSGLDFASSIFNGGIDLAQSAFNGARTWKQVHSS